MTPPAHRRRWPFVVPAVVLALVVAAGGAAYGLGWVDHWRGTDVPPVPKRPELSMTPLTPAAGGVAEPHLTGRPKAEAVRRALAGPLADKHLGRHVLAEVAPLSGDPVLTHGSGVVTPASITKLLTSTAALAKLGPEHRFTTTVTRSGNRLTLVGGGDPLLTSADLATLAAETARSLRTAGIGRVRLVVDATLFTGPSVDPHWKASYLPDEVVAPISALTVDEAHTAGYDGEVFTGDDGRERHPAVEAGQVFAAKLRAAGVSVSGRPTKGSRQGGTIATLRSERLSKIVEHTLELSDNEAAEILARQVGRAYGDASFTGAVAGVKQTLAGLGVDTSDITLYDGSGLSRQDRLSPGVVTAVLQTAASQDHPELAAVISGLPVAGFNGSLDERFEKSPGGDGYVRAKTGTLTGVSGLAGIVTDRRGTPMVVVVMADRIKEPDTLDARAALDDALASIATCTCS